MPSPEKFERYQDFVQLHSTDGVYDPRKGLEGLLSVLSPDPKGIVLAAMEDGEIYFTSSQLYRQTLSWFQNLGLSKSQFPLSHPAPWVYCEFKKDGEVNDGSLVSIGAVVKPAVLVTAEGLRTGYMRSVAGKELAIPLVLQAIEFVDQARESSVPHKYDSMLKIIGHTGSPTINRRPLLVHDIVKFLVEHPGNRNEKELVESLERDWGRMSDALSSLGKSGVIDYQSPKTDIEGKAGRGWSVYLLQQPDALENVEGLYKRIIKERNIGKRSFNPGVGDIRRIIDFIRDHPQDEYETNSLTGKLGMISQHISSILSTLESHNILKLGGNFKSKGSSISSANDLTRMFYDLVCVPAENIAADLTPLPQKLFDRKKVAVFFDNYQEERPGTNQAGDEVRSGLLEAFRGGEEMKRSELADLYNSQHDKALRSVSFSPHLGLLIKQGLVEQTRLGFYRRVV